MDYFLSLWDQAEASTRSAFGVAVFGFVVTIICFFISLVTVHSAFLELF